MERLILSNQLAIMEALSQLLPTLNSAQPALENGLSDTKAALHHGVIYSLAPSDRNKVIGR